MGTAIGGDVNVDTHGKIQADNGLFGAAAISIGGNATLTIGADIDPPLIGGGTFTFGPGTAATFVDPGVTVTADLVGIAGGNLGSGEVTVDIGDGATIDATGGLLGTGIGILKTGGPGDVAITIGTDATVTGENFGTAFSPLLREAMITLSP